MAESSFQFAKRRFFNEVIQRGSRWIRSVGAITPGTVAGERFASLGPGTLIGFPAETIYGEAHMHIGAGTMICSHVTLVAGYGPDQLDVPDRAVVIGERCVVGLRCGIVAHESISIGDDVWFGQDVYVTDANHSFDDPDLPIGQQMGPHDPVSIGSGSWIGHGVVVLPGAQIGRNVVVAAGSVVRGVVPDHSVVAGVPARVIRRLEPGVGWLRAGGDRLASADDLETLVSLVANEATSA